ncbi:ABC transporter substrate-binding protein [Caballeronia sp. SEWSISQ10-4 2]|uniref:ABC transporter substrate-binding protein n=1 Tax=Caballeronia sp. SEWSISQ10-4 2 TaxID=2937438 RepID=UPI0026560596|nr:ABC transporter substrate-binding protein [Caballeronia sp. SEWSISQ10-4 2]MDN7182862.1 ABC transporter substrate-binding protein [Caballeronia sp. SEWSISQ10-4 2]
MPLNSLLNTIRRAARTTPAMLLTASLPVTITLVAHGVEAQTRGGILNMVVTPEPTTLVNLATTATSVMQVSAKVTEGLLDYDLDLQPRPLLATSWDVSGNGRTYTFHLRHGVKWHDGQPFTSADVAWSLQTLRKLHPRARSTFGSVTDIATPDAYTVVLHLAHPAPYLIKAFSASETPIVPKHIYENTDPLTNPANNAPIGTGAFRFVKWVRGSYIEYARNDDYWDPTKPRLDRIIVKVIGDAAARSIALEDGSVDIGGETPVPLSDLGRIQADPRLGLETRGYAFETGVVRIEFNLDNPYLKNLPVRQAIAAAVDRNVIRNVIYYGYANPTSSPIISRPYADASPSPYPYDLKRANALLDAVGYPRLANGSRFALEVDPFPGNDAYSRICAYLRVSLERIGITLTVRNQDLPAYLKRIYTDRDFDMSVHGMSNLFDPSVGVARLYTSTNFRPGVPFTNGSHYSNPDVDRLFQQAAAEPDEARRKQEFLDIQRIIERDLPDITLASPQYVTVYNRRLHDHTVSPDGTASSFADAWLQR